MGILFFNRIGKINQCVLVLLHLQQLLLFKIKRIIFYQNCVNLGGQIQKKHNNS
jgi:hypothetical protein